MEVRNVTPEQIEAAMEAATKAYGGNLYLKSKSIRVPLEEAYDVRIGDAHVMRYTHEYKYVKSLALNKKGTRQRIWIGVQSARRPGARVSQQRHTWLGTTPERVKRIGSACWHAHRDFFREIFEINPDAEIHTALAKYRGKEDFEEKFPATAYGSGMAGPAEITAIGDACNCDEGEWPELAVEGLTEKQYEERLWMWDEAAMKVPKKQKAIAGYEEEE